MYRFALIAAVFIAVIGCGQAKHISVSEFIGKPLVTHIYTADPSAHVFEDRLYVYPSHDEDTGIQSQGDGDQFDMRDYHVLSMDSIAGEVVDHGVALHVDDVPWAKRQMWAPDAAEKNGKYYLYFPAKDKDNIFRIGVAVGDRPEGPFKPEAKPMAGSYTIDPAVFADDDGAYYLYVGGIWGGQLQRWTSGTYSPENSYPADDEPALKPKIAKLSEDMLSLAEDLKDVTILDEKGQALTAGIKNDASLKQLGYTNTMGLTTFRIRQAKHTISSTQQVTTLTGHLPIGAKYLNRCWGGLTTTPS